MQSSRDGSSVLHSNSYTSQRITSELNNGMSSIKYITAGEIIIQACILSKNLLLKDTNTETVPTFNGSSMFHLHTQCSL